MRIRTRHFSWTRTPRRSKTSNSQPVDVCPRFGLVGWTTRAEPGQFRVLGENLVRARTCSTDVNAEGDSILSTEANKGINVVWL
jgi:hypothetical protein